MITQPTHTASPLELHCTASMQTSVSYPHLHLPQVTEVLDDLLHYLDELGRGHLRLIGSLGAIRQQHLGSLPERLMQNLDNGRHGYHENR